jgi:hypothetical protein
MHDELSDVPELPDIVVYIEALEKRILGQTLEGIRLVKSGGGSVVTIGGQPVKLGPSIGIFVRDPNGFPIELIPGT